METNNKVKHQTSKKYLIAFSCASALASFALIAGVAFADEVTTGETHKIDTRLTQQQVLLPMLKQQQT